MGNRFCEPYMVKEVVKVMITTATCETIYYFTATLLKSTNGTTVSLWNCHYAGFLITCMHTSTRTHTYTPHNDKCIYFGI